MKNFIKLVVILISFSFLTSCTNKPVQTKNKELSKNIGTIELGLCRYLLKNNDNIFPRRNGVDIPHTGSRPPYIVKVGDTFSQICEKVMKKGSRSSYTKEAKRLGLKNPNLIIPGQIFYF